MLENYKKERIVNYLTAIFHPIFMPLFFVLAMMVFPSVFGQVTVAYKWIVIKNIAIVTIAIPFLAIIVSRIASYALKENMSMGYNRGVSLFIFFISYISALFILKGIISLKLSLLIFAVPAIIIVCYWTLRRFNYYINLRTLSLGVFTTMLYLFTLSSFAFFNFFIAISIIVSGCFISLFVWSGKSIAREGVAYLLGIISTVILFKIITIVTI